MNIGNQLYSSLSQLARQAYLMQWELPTALNVFDTDYQLESLIFESYTNFMLAVGCITVIVIWGSKYLILM